MISPLVLGSLWLPFCSPLAGKVGLYLLFCQHIFCNDTCVQNQATDIYIAFLEPKLFQLGRKVPLPHSFWSLRTSLYHLYHCQKIPLFLLKPKLQDFTWSSLYLCQCPFPGSPARLRNQRGEKNKQTVKSPLVRWNVKFFFLNVESSNS